MGKFVLMCFVVVMVLSFALIGVIYLVRDMVREARNEVVVVRGKENDYEHTD